MEPRILPVGAVISCCSPAGLSSAKATTKLRRIAKKCFMLLQTKTVWTAKFNASRKLTHVKPVRHVKCRTSEH